MDQFQIKKNYLIAIPTFRNPDTISTIVSEVQRLGLDLLVVDDGSPQKVSEILNLNHLDAKVLEHAKNSGKGTAILTAFLYAKSQNFSHIVTIDADGQHCTSDIFQLIKQSIEHPTDIIIGNRDFKNSIGKPPFSSVFGRIFSNFWVFVETFKLIKDSQSGFRIYPVNELTDYLYQCKFYDFEIEILVRHLWRGGKSTSLPIKVSYLESRVSSFNPIKDNFRFTILHTKLCLLRLCGAGWLFGKGKKEVLGAGFSNSLIRALGPKLSYKFVKPISFVYWVALPHARRAIQDFYNKLRLFNAKKRPDDIYSNNRHTSFKNIYQFSLSIFDRVAFSLTKTLPNIDNSFMRLNTKFESLTILTAHYGDWTLSGIAFSKILNKKSLIVMDQNINPKFMSLISESFGDNVEIINNDADGIDLILKCRRIQEEGGFVCLMADRNPHVHSMKDPLNITFLGHSLTICSKVFKLSLLLRQPVYFFANQRKNTRFHSDYTVKSKELWNSKEDITTFELANRYFKALEEVVIEDPTQWFNFNFFWGSSKS